MRPALTRPDFTRLKGMATRTCERTQLAILRAAYDRAFTRLSRAVREAQSRSRDAELWARAESAKLSYLRARNLMAAFLLQHRVGGRREFGCLSHRAIA
jgi:hypothetical protein